MTKITGIIFILCFIGISILSASGSKFGSLSNDQSNPYTTHRFVMLVGANDGGMGRPRLRYAEDDTMSIAKVFQELGGISIHDTIVLSNPSAAQFISTLNKLEDMITFYKDKHNRTEVFFYYSGHSDENGILLGSDKIDYSKIKEMISSLNSDVKIAILDSCLSGQLTRIKGGKKIAPFMIDTAVNMKGQAFLTSSSYDEASQESDQIRGSFFTHYLVSGLRGAADINQDKKVTLNEAYQYAFNETLERTEKTASGPQHPGYDIDMAGSGEVVMTDISETSAGLILPKESYGRYFLRNNDNVLVLELNKIAGRQLEIGLEEGKYFVVLEQDSRKFQGKVLLEKGKISTLLDKELVSITDEKNSSKGLRDDYDVKPINLSIMTFPDPENSTNRKTLNYVSANLISGYSYRLTGAGFGSLNFVGEDASYFQLAWMMNYVNGDFRGFQGSGVLNVTKGKLSGIQMGIFNYAKETDWAQIGFFNFTAKKVNGLQLGVINYSEDINGIPFGLVSIVKNGPLHGEIWYDEIGFINVALKHGSDLFYNVYSLGYNPNTKMNLFSLGMGFHFQYGNLFLNIEDVFSAINGASSSKGNLYLNADTQSPFLNRIRLYTGYQFYEHLSLIAGVSLNYSHYLDAGSRVSPFHGYEFNFGNDYNHYWPGFFIGVQF